jgi:ribosome-associated protein
MNKNSKEVGKELLDTIINGIEEVKGQEIISLDLRNISGGMCDHFVICHGNSNTQVEAIADKVKKLTQERLDESPWKSEGYGNAQWVLLDYVDIVVHIFYKETRAFYNLEDLWGDADVTRYDSDNESGLKKASN